MLAVSYLESRWDANGGEPSVAAGYGPMHLVDIAAARADTARHPAAARADTAGRHAEDDRGGRRRSPVPRTGGAGTVPTRTVPTRAMQAGTRSTGTVVAGTVAMAARLTGIAPERLRRDPDANVLGGAALLARHQAELGAPASGDPADWYGAVARYSGAPDAGTARRFAGEVFEVIRAGAARTTDDGRQVSLPAAPEIAPHMERAGRPERGAAECPRTLACAWVPAPYQRLSAAPGDYGNHDVSDRPRSQRISYIVVHDTEASYATTLKLVRDPAYVSWHYTIRSADGQVVQHVRTGDAAWHAGNWYVNTKSIGIEHEGFLARGGRWYTEAMYRSSARLVRYLARRYGIPLDRAHILGHDNVPGTLPETVRTMHTDPGPYWDWGHYFELLGRPFEATAGAGGGLVTIRTDYPRHRPRYTGCGGAGTDCPPHGSASVWLRTEPREDAPLVRDAGRSAGPSTFDVYDHGARATTGQQFAVAGRRGEWTAIWYLGRRAWFHNPPDRPTAVHARGYVVTPRAGRPQVPVYGRAYPEPAAYPKGIPVQKIVPLQYAIGAGQRYAVGLATRGEYYYAASFDPAGHRVIRGDTVYYQIQFGHRVAFVMADDVDVLPSAFRTPG
ncbi:amidase [Sphaerisporangium rufum]|uniref:N-acetylmuramoyl-L-alanine amidase n=1 Tax=Sphaerisporangium rufum TaxID=1381558 RepID=A0A919V1K8_9ACTN|nr:amidase [Sphaerisporangium rufum]